MTGGGRVGGRTLRTSSATSSVPVLRRAFLSVLVVRLAVLLAILLALTHLTVITTGISVNDALMHTERYSSWAGTLQKKGGKVVMAWDEVSVSTQRES